MTGIRFFILCVFSGWLPASAAVPETLYGIVRDAATDEPVVGVVVRSKGSYTATDAGGAFRLPLKAGADSVTFRCIGYGTLSLPVSADMSDVRLVPAATQLKDVIVQAPDIYTRGDTLVFNVSRYANAKDNAIIDVIKRLPGIKVEDDGTIKYQGKPINKFYLDGNDFLGGQYSLATDNISYKDVKSVEVMENHQPVKALEGIEFPEEAGINLKLKEDARSRWVGVAQATSGLQPLLYDGSLFTMRIASKVQNMFTLKADNTGWNPATQIREHDFNDMFADDYVSSLWPEYISADMISTPLSEKRTRDNLSWLANAIMAWKSGDTSMRLKLNYIGDRLDYNSGVATDYFSRDIPDFVRNDRLRTRNHNLSAQFNSETNKRGYYLKDKLTLDAVWNNSGAEIAGSLDLLQCVDRRNFSATNDLKLVKRSDTRLFTLTSRNSAGHRTDRLLVSGGPDAVQDITSTDFRSTTETQFGRMSRFWKFYMTAGLDIDCHTMDAALSGLLPFDNAGSYDAFLSNLYATPQLDYERNGWRMSLRLPLKWQHYSVDSRRDYLNVMPRLYIRRQITAKSDLSASAGYALGSPQAYLDITEPVLSDYRNLFMAGNPGKSSHDVSASLSYRYRNPLSAMFFNLSASYSRHHSQMMLNQLFIGDLIVSTYAGQVSDADTWSMSGGISKGLGHSRMVAGCDFSATTTSASSMRDGVVIPYRQSAVSLKPYFKGSILRWLSVNYEAGYSFSKLDVGDAPANYHSFNQNLFATVIPDDRVQLTVGAEHFMTRSSDHDTAGLLLLDASASWQLTGTLRLALTATNLLDSHQYEYVSYGTLSRSEYSFRIRPRNILVSIQCRF